MPELLSVDSAPTIDRVAELAHRIWTEHYPPLIGTAQVAYMLERFQSPAAIAAAIAAGDRYLLVVDDGHDVGYCAWRSEATGLFLSKLYIDRSARGRGLARRCLDHLVAAATAAGHRQLRLTVNKGNTASIAAYQRLGFVISGPCCIDIGGGFVMDDWEMRRPL